MKKIIPTILISLSCASLHAKSSSNYYFAPPTVSIPAGSFIAKDHESNKPYKVNVWPFQMAKYELTIAEFRKFVEETGYKTPNNCMHEIGPRWFGGERNGSWNNNFFALSEYHPVVCIGAKQAEDYAIWLSNKTGKQYRLMSEAQWIYVMRTGGYDKYLTTDENQPHNICEIANLADLHANAMTTKLYEATYTSRYTIEECNDKEILSATVGLYKADNYGVHDLLGNIQEVVADCYVDGKQRFPEGGGPVTHENCDSRVAKGSSWHWSIPNIDTRGRITDDFLAAIEGFRLVIDTGGKSLPPQAGTHEFVVKLKEAQKRTKIVHAQIADYPFRVKNLQIIHKANKIELSWQATDKNSGTTYKVLRQDLLTNQHQVIAKGITENHFIDPQPIENKARYSVVAHFGKRHGLTSNTVDSNIIPTHAIPTRIQGEAFSQGDKVIVRNSTVEPKDDIVFASINNTHADYKIQVENAGKYSLQTRVFHSGETLSFSVLLNDKLLKEITTVGEAGWQTPKAVPITLPKGLNTLTIKPVDNRTRLSINWLDVKKL